MKAALSLCSLALNPAAPSPTASMVKLEGGSMVAFGGTFCIRVPVPVDVNACFSPSKAAVFFRKPRTKVSYTLEKNKLVLKEGKEKLSIPYLDADEMATLDVLSQPQPCELDYELLKHCADIVNPESPKVAAQGISFRNGMMEASNSFVVVSAVSGLEEDYTFNIPVASARAIIKFKVPVVSVAFDGRLVKFLFEDGSSLTSNCIVEQLVDTSSFYKQTWIKCELTPEVVEDIRKIDCDNMVFINNNITYQSEGLEGTLEEAYRGDSYFKISKFNLDFACRIGKDLRVSDNNNLLMSVSENCRIISTLMR